MIGAAKQMFKVNKWKTALNYRVWKENIYLLRSQFWSKAVHPEPNSQRNTSQWDWSLGAKTTLSY